MTLNSLFQVGLNHYLILSAILFSLGTLGLLLRKNILVILNVHRIDVKCR